MRSWSSGFVVLVVASACGSSDGDSDPAPFDVSVYDRTCTTTSDCVSIAAADPCGCGCDRVAIARSEQARYFADRDAYMAEACPAGAVDCSPCPPSIGPSCQDGLCVIAPP